jgi:hypothetical protein
MMRGFRWVVIVQTSMLLRMTRSVVSNWTWRRRHAIVQRWKAIGMFIKSRTLLLYVL